jgi:monooxygenase
MRRMLDRFPRQGDEMPWMNPQDYRKDRKMFRDDPIDDGALSLETTNVDEPAPLREAV